MLVNVVLKFLKVFKARELLPMLSITLLMIKKIIVVLPLLMFQNKHFGKSTWNHSIVQSLKEKQVLLWLLTMLSM
eukprot:jgi/Orpsp1_1/1181272/evm.model.c7180000076564.1